MFRETTHQPEKVGSEKHTHHKNIEIKKFWVTLPIIFFKEKQR
jgi:hypothetical protein